MKTNTTMTVRKLIQLSPAALLLFALMGNTATSCDPIEPLEPVCEVAADCEGLPHMECEGHWSCDAGSCEFQCQKEVVSECSQDADCAEGQVCEILDCIAPDCSPDGPCALSCQVIGECVDEILPPPPPPVEYCDSDEECAPGQVCIFECPAMEACPPGMDGCFVECLGTCQDIEPPPTECWDDSDCPPDFVCEYMDDVYCGNAYDADVPEGGAAPMFCGGTCVYQPTCKAMPCPEGTYFDEAACACLPVEEFCYDDADCPVGYHCDMGADVWCSNADQGSDDADEAPMFCGGVCLADPVCIGLVCPDGTELDPMTCACIPVSNPCIISGCSGQICSAQPVDSTCEWLPYYECFAPAITSCGPFGPNGACMWEPTATLFDCLDKHF